MGTERETGIATPGVRQTVWPWETGLADERAGNRRLVARRALVQSVVMLGIATVLYMVAEEHRVMPMVIFCLAAIVLVSGLFCQPVFTRIEAFGRVLGTTVGVAVSWMLLAPFFYVCFAPARLALHLRGKDPMDRKLRPDGTTFWRAYRAREASTHYSKQY